MISAYKVYDEHFKIFPYECIRNQIKPCHQVGQCQWRITICAKLLGPISPLLNTKSQGQWPSDLGEKCFFPIYGCVGRHGHVTKTIYLKFG